MSSGRPSLPEYAHPPLVAATLGIFFEDPIEVSPASLTEYQRQLGPEWVGDWSDVRMEETNPNADIRLMSGGWQLKNVLHDRVIRVSCVHFAFTWLGTADTRYPRYENVRDGFVAAWDQFAEHQRLAAGELSQWAVSYLNHIPQGTVWQSAADWSFCRLMPESLAARQQVTSANWQLRTPGVSEGLSIDWSTQSSRSETEEPAIWLRLTACGDLNPEKPALLDGMDAGRAAIVQTFSDLLSPAANAYWGLRRREK